MQFAFDGPGSACGVDLTEQLGLGGEQHIVASAHRTMSQRLCDMTLTSAAGSGDEHADLFIDKATIGKINDLLLIDAGVE